MTVIDHPTRLDPVVLDPRVDPRWAELAASHGTLFTSAPWIRAVSGAFDVDVRGSIVEHDGGSEGLVWAELDDPSGRRRSTLPFSDFCDPIRTDARFDWQHLGRSLVDDDVAYTIRMRHRPDVVALPDGAPVTSRFGWHEVDLTRELDEIRASLHPNARQGIRRAERLGAVATVEHGPEAVHEFRRLHVHVRRSKYGMLAQPPEFFDALLEQFGDDSLGVAAARVDGRMVAGVLLLRWRDTTYYKFNASAPEGLELHANDLCMWRSIEHARDRWGTATLDLGLSDLDQPGLLRYKQKYATRVGELVTCANPASADLPQQRRFRTMLNDIAREVLAPDVPEDVSVRTASRVYRYFC